MSKFMNAELVAIRDALSCSHCGVTFRGSDSQAWKVKYDRRAVYCSKTCRHTALRAKFSKPPPMRGPCGTCGKTFASRTAKLFCSIDCYTRSDLFRDLTRAALKKAAVVNAEAHDDFRAQNTRACEYCGAGFYAPPRYRKRFCTRSCWRSYLAARFDRWIASRTDMATLNNYDEFLAQEVLPCLIEGCSWQGLSLTNHMNLAHGVPTDEFKRAAGFNLGTGVIAAPLRLQLEARAPAGVALAPPCEGPQVQPFSGYVSREAREHLKKAAAVRRGKHEARN